MDFIEWLKEIELKEVGTGTNSVAVFSRPIFGAPYRRNQEEIDPFFFKKKPENKKK